MTLPQTQGISLWGWGLSICILSSSPQELDMLPTWEPQCRLVNTSTECSPYTTSLLGRGSSVYSGESCICIHLPTFTPTNLSYHLLVILLAITA